MPNSTTEKETPISAIPTGKLCQSDAVKTVGRAINSQGGEWISFWGYRLLGWAAASLLFSHPVYFAGQYKDFLNELFKDEIKSTLAMTFWMNGLWLCVV